MRREFTILVTKNKVPNPKWSQGGGLRPKPLEETNSGTYNLLILNKCMALSKYYADVHCLKKGPGVFDPNYL